MAERDFRAAAAVGKKAEMTNPDQAPGQDVEQESTNEFGRRQGHQGRLVTLRVILPAKGHETVLQSHQPPVGDGHAVGIAGQIFEDLLGSAKRRFGVDDPFGLRQLVKPAEKVSGLR